MPLLAEIKRRNVFRVVLAYAAVSWLLIQLAALLEDSLTLPEWFDAFVIVSLAIGFPIALVLAWAFELTPSGIRPTEIPDDIANVKPPASGRLTHVTIVVLSIAVAVLLLDNYVLTEERENSIAVLPFISIGEDEDQKRFVDGFISELNTSLTQVNDLRVTDLGSSMTYHDSDKTAQQIAAELGVEYLLRGSIDKSGNTIRVIASLIRGRDGSNVWSEPYDRELNNPQAINLEIAEAVAERLSATFGIGDFDLSMGGTDVVEAYDHYLLAQGWVQQGAIMGRLQNAIAEFERALEFDENFGLAQLRIAQMRMGVLLNVGLTLDGEIPQGLSGPLREGAAEAISKAREDIERAQRMMPEHPALLTIDARRRFDQREWLQAEETLRARLAQTGPSDFEGNMELGIFLIQIGRAQESLRYLEHAHALNPLVSGPLVWLALAHDALGDFETAVSLNEEAQTLLGYSTLGQMAQVWRQMARGEFDAANQALANTEWEGILDQLTPMYESMASGEMDIRQAPLPTVAANIGLTAAAYGDFETALEAWQWTLPRSPAFLFWSWMPLMNDVRRQPDFELLIRELGLPEYWRASGWPEHCRQSEVESFDCD